MTIIQEYTDHPFASDYFKSVIEKISFLENAIITAGFATMDELFRLECGFTVTKYLSQLVLLADYCDEMSAPQSIEDCEEIRDSDSLAMSDESVNEPNAARYSPFMLV